MFLHLFTIFIIKIGLVSEIHHSSIKYARPAQPQIPNTRRMNIAYNIRIFFFLLFSFSFFSFIFSLHLFIHPIVCELSSFHRKFCGGWCCCCCCSSACALSLIYIEIVLFHLSARLWVWILFISSTHKIHSLFIPHFCCSILYLQFWLHLFNDMFLGVFSVLFFPCPSIQINQQLMLRSVRCMYVGFFFYFSLGSLLKTTTSFIILVCI